MGCKIFSQTYLLLLLSLISFTGLVSCGGGGGGGDPTPTVTSTSPIDGATGAPRNTTLSATFNKDILATSVDTSSFSLSDSAALSGTVSFNGDTNVASFTPDRPLDLLTTYTATLTTAITDLSGNSLAGNYSWSFTSADGDWGSASLIETNSAGTAISPQISVDNSGNGLVVWSQYDGTRYNIWANRYDATSGWGTPELIETNDAGSASAPQIAVNNSGNALAVWQQSDGTRTNIWANRYDAITGWGTAVLIETDDVGDASGPQPVLDSSGNALVVWQQSDSTRTNIWANRYDATTGWGTAALIETDNAGYAVTPQIAMDATGNALAVWSQFDATRSNIWANRYDATTGWATAELIETDDGNGAGDPSIAFDAGGNALAVWVQSASGSPSVAANRYVNGSGWGTAEFIETASGWVYNPQVAMDDNGNGLAVWEQDATGSSSVDIWASRYAAGTGWGTPELIEANEAGSASVPQVAFDDNGNALAVWQQGDNMLMLDNIWANRYVDGTGWTGAELIENDDTSTADDPQIAIDNNGNALAVWSQSDLSNFNIWSNRFE